MTTKTIKTKINRIVKQRLAEGWKFNHKLESVGHNGNSGCLKGCLFKEPDEKIVAQMLGCKIGDIISIENGYENWPNLFTPNPELFNFARRLSMKLTGQ